MIFSLAWYIAYGFAAIYVILLIFCFAGLLRLKKQTLIKDKDCPDVTVIICAKDEEDNIQATLESVLNQDYPKDKVHLITVDDRSADKTGEILESYKDKFHKMDVLHIAECPKGVSPKKNALKKALELVETQFIMATDADALHKPGWLRSYVSLDQKGLGLATGVSVFAKDKFSSKWEERWQSMQTLENLSHNMVTAGAMGNGWGLTSNGNNVYYNKSIFKSENAMRLDVIAGDDTFTVYEAMRQNLRVVFNIHPDSLVKLVPENSIKDVANQRVRWGSIVIKSNISVVLLGIFIELFYLSIILFPFWALYSLSALPLWLGLAGIKIVADLSYMMVSLKRFKIPYRLSDLLLMEIVQAPFIIYCGITGLFGKFTWKD